MQLKEMHNMLKDKGFEEKNRLINKMVEMCNEETMDNIIKETFEKYDETNKDYLNTDLSSDNK